MKYYLNLIFLFILSLSCLGQSYNASRIYGPVSTTGPDSSILVQSLVGWHQVSWVVTGSPAACTVKIEQSPDNVTWSDLIANQTCTSAGSSAISANLLPYYIRINVTALSGGTNPTIIVIYEGWASNPNPVGTGGGSVTQGTTPWVDNITQFGGTNISTGIGASGAGIPRVSLSNDSVLAANQSVNVNQIAGATVGTAAAGVQKVGIVGANSGANTLDSSIVPGGAPTNGIGILGQYNTTAPVPTNTQTLGIQTDAWGDIHVREFRRGKTVCTPTTITNSLAPTTVLAAQGSGTFGDITLLYMSAVPGATADISFTATLSDGTTSYIFDMDTGALATATAPMIPVNATFNPPMPATSGNVAWTITLSVNTVTVHITVCAVDQK